MSRFKECPLQMMDLGGRFEAGSSSVHVRNALGAIERLKDEGTRLWDEDSDQLTRWNEGCAILWGFLNTLGQRRHETSELSEVMREFIQEFEHSTYRIRQMLYGRCSDTDDETDAEKVFDWCCLIFQLSIYALVSFWIDDKTEELSVKVKMNMSKKEVTQEWTHKDMQVPKKHRHTTKWP